jgi:hypothetical protein
VRPHEHDFIDPNADDWDVGNSEWDAEVEAEMKASL